MKVSEIHALQKMFDNEYTDAKIILDAVNAFNTGEYTTSNTTVNSCFTTQHPILLSRDVVDICTKLYTVVPADCLSRPGTTIARRNNRLWLLCAYFFMYYLMDGADDAFKRTLIYWQMTRWPNSALFPPNKTTLPKSWNLICWSVKLKFAKIYFYLHGTACFL